MKHYEYKALDFSCPACLGMEAQLNKLGKEGWELVSVCPKDSNEFGISTITAFFKREICVKP